MKPVYIIAASKKWFLTAEKSDRFVRQNFVVIEDKDLLNPGFLKANNPRYIFFPHWNWRVSEEIYSNYECIVFHTAPLPFGRGGSPIQNLIRLGHKRSPICALKMTGELDAGPIYRVSEVSLDGSITEIYSRIAVVIESMIIDIIESEPIPIEQSGSPTYFQRIKPEESELSSDLVSLEEIYDRIRMVDGAGYPPAFIRYGNLILEFHEAEFQNNELSAKVSIRKC